GDRRGAVRLDQLVHEGRDVALLERLVDEAVGAAIELLAQRLLERTLDPVVEDDPADRGQDVAALTARRAELRRSVQLDHAVLVGELGLLRGAEDVRAALLAVELR